MAKGLITKGLRKNTVTGVVLLGVELNDAKEEIFVRMVCDGLALGIAYSRAGFTSKAKNAAAMLFNLPRVQERAGKILEARRSTGVVTLPQVTDMLQRVFAGAHSEGEYSAAHNAAFSLARLYGHVTDKATLEVIRRPSRDPDAPSEQALESWAASLPVVSSDPALGGPFQGPPAALLGPEPQPCTMPTTQPDVVSLEPSVDWLGGRSTQGPGPASRGVETGNGAPVGPVTGTPSPGGQSEPLGGGRTAPGPGFEKGPPVNEMRVPATPGEVPGVANEPPKVPGYGEGVDWPSAEELFG